MKAIYKYPIQITDHQEIELPEGAEILTAKIMQKDSAFNELFLWAVVDPSREVKRRKIWVFGTGHPMTEIPLTYIATVLHGPFVWHIFEETI